MPVVQIGLATRIPSDARGHPKVVILSERGVRLTVPLAPTTEIGGLARSFAQQERPFNTALLTPTTRNLRTINAKMEVVGYDAYGHIDNQVSIEGVLRVLREFAASGERVMWTNLGPSEAGWYRIVDMDITPRYRQFRTNFITQASVDIGLTEASDPDAQNGPVTGGARPIARTTPRPAISLPTRAYVVTRGDTLSGIALRFYGDASQYPRIATANGIRNPHLIYPGQRLTIPS